MHKKLYLLIAAIIFCMGIEATALGVQIIVEGESARWEEVPQYPSELLAASAKVQPRILAEYATVIFEQDMSYPGQLVSETSDVSGRIVVEYASSIGQFDLKTDDFVEPRSAVIASFTLTPEQPTTQDIVRFTDRSEVPDGRVVSWRWHFGDGRTSTEQHPRHRYADNGTYTVELVVTDDRGAEGRTQEEIAVSNVPPEAIVQDTPLQGSAPLDVSFDGSDSKDVDGEIVEYEWDFGDGSPSQEGVQLTHTYRSEGTFIATLMVTDDDGAASQAKVTITVFPRQTVRARLSSTPKEPTRFDELQFTDESTVEPRGEIRRWLWNFGDGTTSTEENPRHHYTEDGTYRVTLTVITDEGVEATASRTITVFTPPQPRPGGLVAKPGDASADLSWSPFKQSGFDLEGYNIYRSSASGAGYMKLNGKVLRGTSYRDDNLRNGTTYYYVITAVDTSGNETRYSGEVSATPTSTSGIGIALVAAILLGVIAVGAIAFIILRARSAW